MQVQKPWLESYPPNIPAEIDADAFSSLVDIFDRSIGAYRDQPAYSNFGKQITYGDLDRLSGQFAAYLLGELHLKKGDRVAIMLPNCLQYPIALFGTLRAGLTVVNVNPLYTPRELQHQLEDAGVRVLVAIDNFGNTVQASGVAGSLKQVITTGLGDLLGAKGRIINFALKYVKKLVPDYDLPNAVRFRDALKLGSKHNLPQVHVDSEDIAFLQYTGGTTGIAKGAMLTHRNMVANLQQVAAWFDSIVRPGQEIVITALPLYHIFALTCNCFVFLRFGGHNVLITNPRDMPAFVKELSKTRFTVITGVNTLFNGLLNAPGFEKIDFSSLRMSFGGGMAVQRSVAECWKELTRRALIEGYGMTESSPVATINPMLPDSDFNGSIGLPIPSTEACIKDDAGNQLPLDEVGELCLKGPQVMKGYWKRPDETALAIDADGWLHTGDMARMDANGYLYIVDRKKDMILVSGFNVYPNEIEDILSTMPGVLEVAAIGVPSEKSGETVKVIIVKKDPALTEAQVKEFAHANLTGYKVPRIVEFRKELPKSNVGKILRRELR